MNNKQVNSLLDLIKSIDTSKIENIDISGYCDDIGNDNYNYTLSYNRATTIRNQLTRNGIKNKILITIKGKGRVLIDKDTINDLTKTRSKNRRVDVIFHFKRIPGLYSTISEKCIVGDRILLKNVLFERGRSILSAKAKNELDKIVILLKKHRNVHFEIQGHVCCTPSFQKEAINRDTKKRSLSIDRARTVYKYFIFRKIPKSRMTFKGYGTSKTLGRESKYDRRVELLITKV